MVVSNITMNRETQEIKLYFKEYDYCVTTQLTWQTWRMYCEFNNIPMKEYELIAVDINTIKWDNDFEKLVAF